MNLSFAPTSTEQFTQIEETPIVEESISESVQPTIPAPIPTPFGTTSFTSIAGTSNNIIAEITPAKFDSFVKILSLLDKSSDSIVINNSAIMQQYNRSLLYADINEVFDKKPVTLQILNPKKNVKLLKQFKNNNNIYIIDDNDNSRYILTNNEIKLFLPKQSDTTLASIQMPDHSDAIGVCESTIDKDSAKTISGLADGSNYIEYLIQDNLLKAIHIPDTAIYILNEFIQDPQTNKLDETSADLALRSHVYLPVTADEYKIQIGKTPGGEYFSYTTCDTGLIKINVYENLDLTTGGNLLL